MIALRERNTPCLGGQVCRLEIQKFVRGATWLPANALKPVTQDTIARAHRLTALLRSRRARSRVTMSLAGQPQSWDCLEIADVAAKEAPRGERLPGIRGSERVGYRRRILAVGWLGSLTKRVRCEAGQ